MVEMVISLSIVSVFILAIGNVIADSYSVWNNIYDYSFGNVSQGILNTQASFNKMCRKASLRDVTISEDKTSIRLYYFSDYINPSYFPDMHAKYYLDGTTLKLEIAEINQPSKGVKRTVATQVLSENVTYLSFTEQSLSIQMCMRVNDGRRQQTFTWAAVRHN